MDESADGSSVERIENAMIQVRETPEEKRPEAPKPESPQPRTSRIGVKRRRRRSSEQRQVADPPRAYSLRHTSSRRSSHL